MGGVYEIQRQSDFKIFSLSSWETRVVVLGGIERGGVCFGVKRSNSSLDIIEFGCLLDVKQVEMSGRQVDVGNREKPGWR